ncbi:hypothetical protein GCM10010140_57900 [Streptosporangium pseudovulgare]|uniref:MFS transporter n=1 Tax=Streptosporangium pseudovulgare TaxID=35765 RepID=A0ABQ2RB12_9ACTN|nr:hypothetical protein GCM10010140_57900 [Streptosporangium pseudovulgare]
MEVAGEGVVVAELRGQAVGVVAGDVQARALGGSVGGEGGKDDDAAGGESLTQDVAVGLAAGGVLYTAMPVPQREDRRLLLLPALSAVGYLPLALTPALRGMAPLVLAAGPASAFALVARLAPEGTLTEAHAWVITALGAGNAGGSALAGTLADPASPAAAFVSAALSATIAVCISPTATPGARAVGPALSAATVGPRSPQHDQLVGSCRAVQGYVAQQPRETARSVPPARRAHGASTADSGQRNVDGGWMHDR